MAATLATLALTYGEEVAAKITNARILVVGAGGIGCELLKNLVKGGLTNIEIIDLDTIDVSNLNRQFLFNKSHVGKSKSQIARESAMAFHPAANIVAHHGNIKDPNFGVSYFKGFDLVVNALDNQDARRHVNRICLASDIPHVESGTAGYLGQTQVIVKNKTACYECDPSPAPKTYPVCTIRSTPSTPIHCIVWAKMIFGRLFGTPDEALEEVDSSGDQEDAAVSGELDENIHVLYYNKTSSDADYAASVLKKLFVADINKLLSLEDLWKSRSPPSVLDVDKYMGQTEKPEESAEAGGAEGAGDKLPDQVVWTVQQCVNKFLSSVSDLRTRVVGSETTIEWDKDDEPALDFVTAAANIRATLFAIPNKSRWDVKGDLGAIIPAIATTNAIIASLIVTEAYELLADNLEGARNTFLLHKPSVGKILLPTRAPPPKPSCYVCSSRFVTLTLNTEKSSIGLLVNSVLKDKMKLSDPMVVLGEKMLYEAPDPEDYDTPEEAAAAKEKSEARLLGALGVKHNGVLSISDMTSDLALELSIVHDETLDPSSDEADKVFKLEGADSSGGTRVAEPMQEDSKSVLGKRSRSAGNSEVIAIDDDDDDDGATGEAAEEPSKRART